MTNDGVSRRALLVGAGAVAATAGLVGTSRAEAGAVRIGPADPRYENLLRGNNFRFAGTPDEIRLAASAEQVVRVVDEAVRAGKGIGVRSGGHCFENLTADRDHRVLLDLAQLNEVGYDEEKRAFAVQPGATLGQVYRALLTGWGVTIPGGGCPEVGAGGHIAGGGYGPLSRRYGSVVDHLYGVEVVVVGKDGRTRKVVATREPDDPNRELWWAHTGGGGGNFGVVTKYWLRDLPPSPRRMLQHVVFWDWGQLDEAKVTRLVNNFGTWHERNSAPGNPNTGLYGVLEVQHRAGGTVMLSAAEGVRMTRLLVVDDHPVVQDGLTSMFARDTDFEVVGEAGDGAEAVRLAHALRPDVVLMDLRMPGDGTARRRPGCSSRRPP